MVYLDDILIYSISNKEHAKYLRLILERLRNDTLYYNPKKCDLFINRVKYLGFIVSLDRVAIDLERI